jgi:hypothetical protein
MPVITLDQARAHLRVEPDYPAEQIQAYIAGAESAAAKYLNRTVFPDEGARDAALDAIPAALAAAQVAFDSAVAAADGIVDPTARQATIDVARARLTDAQSAAIRDMNGIVSNPSIVAACLLTVGHLYANRTDVVVGASVAELPNGARSLLRPDRRVMMP